MADEERAEQELLDALRQLRVSDVLVQSLSTVSSLGFHRLDPETRDLEQARLAIESLRALVPVLREALPVELVRDFESVTVNLQLAYAAAVAESPRSDEPAETEAPLAGEEPRPEDEEPPAEEHAETAAPSEEPRPDAEQRPAEEPEREL